MGAGKAPTQKKGSHMNTDNIDLSGIKWMLFKPAPDKTGYLVFDRNITVDKFEKEIQERLPKEIASCLDYCGATYCRRNEQLKEQICGTDSEKDAFNTYLTTEWAPGSNEGYYAHVYAVTPGTPRRMIWMAKTFNALAAIALDACLHCWTSSTDRYLEHATRKVLAGIPLQEG
jgi:hypothetical protein